MTRERKSFSSEFKLQMVRLYENGKPRKMDKATSKHGYIQSPR
ncbi:TPA: hypothetical protein ACNH5L_000002 [Staphylococcus aureus]|nr:hypothetical protein [Staphylococcus aureus]UUR09758.1 hypothetical protein SAA6159_03025 [Staphylococcus aureus subsp. aureus JKD6159]